MLTRLHAFVLVFILWAAIFLPYLGTPEFKGEEARRVLPAVTMLETGDWIVPYVGGEAYYNKPPLINWLVALSFLTTGEHNEMAARLPSVLLVLAFVSLLVGLRGPWLSLEARVMAAIIFMTNVGLLEKGRLIEIEAVYVCLTGLAVVWWLEFRTRPNAAWRMWLGAGIFLAGGMLTKGPLILLVFYGTVLSVLIYSRRLKDLFCWEHAVGLVLWLGLSLGWARLAMDRAADAGMVQQMSQQITARFVQADIDYLEWFVDVLKAFLNLVPWLVLAPLVWKRESAALITEEHKPLFQGCALGVGICFVLVNLMPGTASRYSLPVVGPASVLLGWVLSLQPNTSPLLARWRTFVLAGLGVASLCAIVGTLAIKVNPASLVLAVLATSLTLLAARHREALDTFFRMTVLTGLLAAVLISGYAVFGAAIMPRYEKRRPAGAAVNAAVPAQETLYVFKPGYQAFLFYVRPPLRYLIRKEQIDDSVQFLLIRGPDFERLRQQPVLSQRNPEVLLDFSYRHKGDFKLVRLRRQ